MNAIDFEDSIRARFPELTDYQVKNAALFAQALYAENEVQNLTRIVGVGEFVELHLVDVVELLRLPTLGKRVLDVGTGSGVPGLLAAAIDLDPERVWFLSESEVSKAQFLDLTAKKLGLLKVAVLSKRVESIISMVNPDTVMARAVGTVEKIAGWIWECSTWNNLVLFKSRGWEAEWNDAKVSRFGKKLTVTHTKDYSNPDRTRLLISLTKRKIG